MSWIKDTTRCLTCFKLLKTWKNTKSCNSYSVCSKVSLNDGTMLLASTSTDATEIVNSSSCCASSNLTPKSSLSSISSSQMQMDTMSIDSDCDPNPVTINDLLEKLFNIKSSKSCKICESCFQNLKFVYVLWYNFNKYKANLEHTYKKTRRLLKKRSQTRSATTVRKSVTGQFACNGQSNYRHNSRSTVAGDHIVENQIEMENSGLADLSLFSASSRRKRKSLKPSHYKQQKSDMAQQLINANVHKKSVNKSIDQKLCRNTDRNTDKQTKAYEIAIKDECMHVMDDGDPKSLVENEIEQAQHQQFNTTVHTMEYILNGLNRFRKIKDRDIDHHQNSNQQLSNKNYLLNMQTPYELPQQQQPMKHKQAETYRFLATTPIVPSKLANLQTSSFINEEIRGSTDSLKNTCKVCDKSFKTQNILRQHLRIHTGDKPFVCTVCTKAFSQMASLKYHLATHSDERPYCCPKCSKTFKLKPPFKKHMRECITNYKTIIR